MYEEWFEDQTLNERQWIPIPGKILGLATQNKEN